MQNSSQPFFEFTDGEALSCLPLGSFPATRYQGSKRRLLSPLAKIFGKFNPGTALDLYSGTATVSLLLRMMGWRVIANDFLLFNNVTAELMLSDKKTEWLPAVVERDIKYLLMEAPIDQEPLVTMNFADIYFHKEENLEIDRFSQNVATMPEALRPLYIYSVGQALLMKRPYNLFHRANLAMRTRDVSRSFGNFTTWNKATVTHAAKIASSIIKFPFKQSRPDNLVTGVNTLDLSALPNDVDLVYLDPPYLNKAELGVDYCHFYHFLDGLCDYDLFKKFDERFAHKPIVGKPSAWLKTSTAVDELDRILNKWHSSVIVMSYRDDGRPNLDAISSAFSRAGRNFSSVDSHDYKYALSHAKNTKEMFLISLP